MLYMFSGCSGLKKLYIDSFDTGNVKTMCGMFEGCSSLTILDLKNFDTAQVEDMSSMFSYCSSLTSLDLSCFNTSMVEDMNLMFDHCNSLRTIYVDTWDISNVKQKWINTALCECFCECISIVGGKGTVYDEENIDLEYAHIDGGPSNPGYFTYKSK